MKSNCKPCKIPTPGKLTQRKAVSYEALGKKAK